MNYLSLIREQKPLIHHLTNWVTIYDCAQMVRSVGALPVMAHAPEEVEEMVGLAGALVLNIGTLTKDFIDAQIRAGRRANERGIPVVLDVVGCGATSLRTNASNDILQQVHIDVVKGNRGEIGTLAGSTAEVRGVEAIGTVDNIEALAAALAKRLGSTVVVTGKVDIVTNGSDINHCDVGHDLMGHVVGTGCMAASVLGCFAAVAPGKNYLESSTEAMTFYGRAAERAAPKATGPMDFKAQFLDEIANAST